MKDNKSRVPIGSEKTGAFVADFSKFQWSPTYKGSEETFSVSSSSQENLPCVGIKDSILDCIGNTPLVRLRKIGKDLDCELLAKCEYMNPGGSIKDRIAKQMIADAEKQGKLKPGNTLVEPTSGNTGVGLSLVAAAKGYNCVIPLPKKMSNEKVSTMKALGSKVIRTPNAPHDDPDSNFSVAKRLQRENPNTYVLLDQFSNPSNPLAHENQTAEEIWEQCEGKIDMIVATAGTGGTITGIARGLKRKNPNIIVVGVDPYGSVFHDDNAPVKPYLIEGIGYDFIPEVLDRSLIDRWEVTHDKESFENARRLIKEEALLIGGSSGSVITGALRAAKNLKKGQRCVVILPDSIRNYLSKFVDDEWMISNGFMEPEEPVPKRQKTDNFWIDQVWSKPNQ